MYTIEFVITITDKNPPFKKDIVKKQIFYSRTLETALKCVPKTFLFYLEKSNTIEYIDIDMDKDEIKVDINNKEKDVIYHWMHYNNNYKFYSVYELFIKYISFDPIENSFYSIEYHDDGSRLYSNTRAELLEAYKQYTKYMEETKLNELTNRARKMYEKSLADIRGKIDESIFEEILTKLSNYNSSDLLLYQYSSSLLTEEGKLMQLIEKHEIVD